MEALKQIVDQLRSLDGKATRGENSHQFIEVLLGQGEVIVGGNREGLVHLALRCAELAMQSHPGSHCHIDESSVADRADVALVLRVSSPQWGGK